MNGMHIFNHSGQQLKINWSNSTNLKRWLAIQRIRSSQIIDKPDNEFYREYQKWIQRYWYSLEAMGTFDLPDNASILDIGSGIGLLDMFLSRHLVKSKITLLDKDELGELSPEKYYGDHPFYNSWEPTLDIINTSKLNPNRFMFIGPEDDWPSHYDLIMSHFSWGWHYQYDKYVHKVYQHLKPNGKLLISIRYVDDPSYDLPSIIDNNIGVISKKITWQLHKKDRSDFEKGNIETSGDPYYGALMLWVK